MKRSKIALIAAACFLVVACAVCWFFFTHADSEHIYSPVNEQLELIEGGDLFELTYLGMNGAHTGPTSWFKITPLREGQAYTFSGIIWENGVEVGRQQEHSEFYEVYRETKGGLEFVSYPGHLFGRDPTMEFYYVLPREQGDTYFHLECMFPQIIGRIHVTLNLYECTAEGSTVGDVIPVTFVMENWPTGELYDAVNVGFSSDPRRDYPAGSLALRVLPNDGWEQFPFLDMDSVKIEDPQGRVLDGVWVDKSYLGHGHEEVRYHRSVIKGDGYFYSDLCSYLPIITPKFDTLGDDVYTLTLEFAENEDGSGERYTLTLKLRFNE